jgi:hypothetical protein
MWMAEQYLKCFLRNKVLEFELDYVALLSTVMNFEGSTETQNFLSVRFLRMILLYINIYK